MSETPEAEGYPRVVEDVVDYAQYIEGMVGDLSMTLTRSLLHEAVHAGRICGLCHIELTDAEIDDPNAIYRQVSSWVTGPKLQSPVLRSQTGAVAHRSCIEKVINGQSPDQQSIPGLGDN